MVKDYRATPSDDPVNYVWKDAEGDVSIKGGG